MTSAKEHIDVNRWKKIAALGSGRTGRVALCEEPISTGSEEPNSRRPRVLHAVKRVPRRGLTSGGAARSVLREKAALQALKGNLGIVDLRSTSKDDENLYFVLEPLLGGPLHKHIRAGPRGRLEVPTARFYASEISSAIVHMHTLHIMHRDIKASNIVLCARGHAKLVDLGSTKQLVPRRENGSDDSGSSWEKSYTYCGTPHCMAPEMVSREGHTPAVDWWALGILVHEMVTGDPPFGYGGDDLPRRISEGIPKDGDRTADFGEEVEALERPSQAGKEAGEEPADEDVGTGTFLPIVRRLLDIDPRQRLGSAGGADEVMAHAWFATIDWATTSKFEAQPPPFRRDLGELDVLDEGGAAVAEDIDPDGLFAGF